MSFLLTIFSQHVSQLVMSKTYIIFSRYFSLCLSWLCVEIFFIFSFASVEWYYAYKLCIRSLEFVFICKKKKGQDKTASFANYMVMNLAVFVFHLYLSYILTVRNAESMAPGVSSHIIKPGNLIYLTLCNLDKCPMWDYSSCGHCGKIYTFTPISLPCLASNYFCIIFLFSEINFPRQFSIILISKL